MSSSTPIKAFIGREREIATLRAALDSALAGKSRTVVVAGAPGIGKTWLARALADIAVERGAAVLSGRCHQEPGAPPYWPWTQMLRLLMGQLDEHDLRAVLGGDARQVARIYPELMGRLPGLTALPPFADAAQERFRLFDAVTEVWKRAAARQPLALILEDLHWADELSLRLVEFVAGEVGTSRILLVGTLRDVDGSSRNLLGELARKASLQRVMLAGLTLDETSRLLEAATAKLPSQSTAAFVYSKTDGNPLFVSEMAYYLEAEGLLTGNPLRAAEPTRTSFRVPEGIRTFIETRVHRLSLHAQRMLTVAAVIGTQFSLALLRRLVEDISEEDALAAFDEALATRIIEELNTRGWYEFDHVLTRDTLYERMPSLERARIHECIGTELEQQHQHNPAPYLALLAYHFHATLPLGSSSKAVAYAMQAAEQARTRFAYEDAVRCFGMALSALDQTASADLGLRCKLVIALGDAQMKAGRAVEALETLTEAASRARHLGAAKDLTEAAIDFEEITWRLGLPSVRAARLLEQSIEQLTQDDEAGRARLQSSLVRALAFSGSSEHARQLHGQTVSLARRAGDPAAMEAALRSVFWLQSDPADLEELLAVSEETVLLARQLGSKERELDAAAFRLNLLIAIGDYAGFTRDLEEFVQIADRLRQPFHEYHGTAMRAAEALFVGRFAEAEQLARRAATLGARSPGLDASGAFGMQMFALAQERGQLQQLAPSVRQFMQLMPKRGTWRPALALTLAELGQFDQAIAELEQLAPKQFQAVDRDSLWPACLAYMAQACALSRDVKHAGELYALLLPWQGRNLVATSMVMCYGPADRLLGMLCTILGRWDGAARHFDAALAMNERQGSKPWLAHTRYEYAVMLAERNEPGDQERAGTLLAGARLIAEALDMAKVRDAVSQLERRLDGPPRTSSFPGGLSRREAEVLRMVASGKSNQEIAATIFRSPNTVAKHVSSILSKLGAANRTEAATFAARHGLL